MECRVTKKFGLHQIVLNDNILPYIDPGFIPLDWKHNPWPGVREILIHAHVAEQKLYRKYELTGAFSAKFYTKTNLKSHDVKTWINNNPGYDVYMICGGPYFPYMYYNGIDFGTALRRDDFEIVFRQMCEKIGLDIPSKFGRQTNINVAYCSFFVGTQNFWDEWSNVLTTLLSKDKLGDDLYNSMHSPAIYYESAPTIYLSAFLYERLIPIYLMQKGIKVKFYEWDRNSILALQISDILRQHLIRIMPVIDDMDKNMLWTDSNRDFPYQETLALRQRATGELLLNWNSTDYNIPSVAFPK